MYTQELIEKLTRLNEKFIDLKQKKQNELRKFDISLKRLDIELSETLGERFYTANELAGLLGMSHRDVLRAINRNSLGEAVQVQNQWYIEKESVELEVMSQADSERLKGLVI
tara:strand:+ start:645 stop:980 length:336 start_codon:yes stop_codon:yes gene_type:complete